MSESEQNNWYTFVNEKESLVQGDVLFECPVFFPDPKINYMNLNNPAEINMEMDKKDVIIMTQSCDIERLVETIAKAETAGGQDAQRIISEKAKTGIVLCPLARLTSVPAKQLSNLIDNKLNNLHLLNNYVTEDGKEHVGYLIVDFSTFYTVPFGVLTNWIKSKNESRPRLKAPFLELMAQRFGYRFMRIGLENKSNVKLDDLRQNWEKLKAAQSEGN